jgi:tryptophanyl-tRNA synthetase
MDTKKRIITGIKPTGEVQIGNYLSVIKNLIEIQDKYEIFFMIANLHAQTVPYNPKELKKLTYNIAKSCIALGMNPKKIVIFRQSDIIYHPYLTWILLCITPLGELQRMHEFKEQSQKYSKEGIGTGILLYPILMAADILIYNPDLVIVGEDQRQHLELTREIARKFNKKFGNLIKIPEFQIREETAKIMSLSNPYKKMSKSEPQGCLEIFAPLSVIKEKILKAVTDSENEIKYDPLKKPAISNLMTIYKYLTNKTYQEIEVEFKNKGYYQFKLSLFNAFVNYFKEARIKFNKIKNSEIEKIFKNSAKKLNKIAYLNLKKIIEKTGLK